MAIANPSEMITNYEAGNRRALAVATEECFAPFEDVPTLTERGYMPSEEFAELVKRRTHM